MNNDIYLTPKFENKNQNQANDYYAKLSQYKASNSPITPFLMALTPLQSASPYNPNSYTPLTPYGPAHLFSPVMPVNQDYGMLTPVYSDLTPFSRNSKSGSTPTTLPSFVQTLSFARSPVKNAARVGFEIRANPIMNDYPEISNSNNNNPAASPMRISVYDQAFYQQLSSIEPGNVTYNNICSLVQKKELIEKQMNSQSPSGSQSLTSPSKTGISNKAPYDSPLVMNGVYMRQASQLSSSQDSPLIQDSINRSLNSSISHVNLSGAKTKNSPLRDMNKERSANKLNSSTINLKSNHKEISSLKNSKRNPTNGEKVSMYKSNSKNQNLSISKDISLKQEMDASETNINMDINSNDRSSSIENKSNSKDHHHDEPRDDDADSVTNSDIDDSVDSRIHQNTEGMNGDEDEDKNDEEYTDGTKRTKHNISNTNKDNKETLSSDLIRVHCRCKKSHCLKLYCECFAKQLLCDSCTCQDCYNIEKHRASIIEAQNCILARDPQAFSKKIAESSTHCALYHTKGCNCKKSNCLKKYCECYQAGIPCGISCKCKDCFNREQPEKKSQKRRMETSVSGNKMIKE